MRTYPDRAYLCFTYDEPLSHLIYAASDMFLVPSMFEPCGLTQVIFGGWRMSILGALAVQPKSVTIAACLGSQSWDPGHGKYGVPAVCCKLNPWCMLLAQQTRSTVCVSIEQGSGFRCLMSKT